MADSLSTVFESKMGSCSEGHACSEAELAATSVPVPAEVFAYVNSVGGPGGVVVNVIEPALKTDAFGSSECLVMCSAWDSDGAGGTCEPLDYGAVGEELKAFQKKQFQLSSFLYTVGKDMVLESVCAMDSMHRVLRGRSLKPGTVGLSRRQLAGGGGAAPVESGCDGMTKKCMYQDCGGNFTLPYGNLTTTSCYEGECVDGVCLPVADDFQCDAVMQEFEAAAQNCSTLVVIDGIAEGFECLGKYVADLYGDCTHQPDPDMEACSHTLVIGTEIIHAFEHAIEQLKTDPTLLVEKMMYIVSSNSDLFGKMKDVILDMTMPIWSDAEEDPHNILDGSDFHVVMDMCDPLLSFGRATDITWDQSCVLFESIMCLSINEGNVTYMGTDEGAEMMYFCARAFMSYYPMDDGVFSSCLEASASNAGGPAACVDAELHPLIVQYIHSGAESLYGTTVTSPTGADQSHNLEDAMYTATMDPADVIDASAEMATYTYLRRLYEKRRRLKAEPQDCLTINGKEYCTKDTSSRSLLADPPVPASNGKPARAHKFFTRKHKARRLRRAHKNLIRKHRQLHGRR
jgi:hypothetical protein